MTLFLIALVPTSARAGGARRPERLIAVKLKVAHAYQCTACATRVTQILRTQDGVRDARAIAAQDAAVVIFTSGKGDIDEMRRALKLAGFVTHVVWGPAAAKLDGRFEENPLDEIAYKRPTLKETQAIVPAKPTAKTATPLIKKTSGYLPLRTENLPGTTD